MNLYMYIAYYFETFFKNPYAMYKLISTRNQWNANVKQNSAYALKEIELMRENKFFCPWQKMKIRTLWVV